ncbi:MAG: hypothetical protein JJ974_07945 [Phycisphaerales bacterium]|nr:hypothetical protein [Phycisphaerales bacterium]
MPGIVQILDSQTKQVVWQFSAGYHPDCVVFTPDGRYLILANECEPGIQDRAGSVTLVDLLGVQSAFDMQGMNEIQTYGFRDRNLGEGVTLSDLRIPASLRSTPWIGIEPEYLAPTNDGVWVSLQENNAIAYFDFECRKWTKIQPLNPLSYPFDADDKDGIHIQNHKGISLLPMPDTIAHTVIDERAYVLIANEGEKDEHNSLRFEDAVTSGLLDPLVVHQLQTSSNGSDQLGRLWISTIDGDIDHDGDIDVPSALGARSVSLYDVLQDTVIWNSQEQHEVVSAMLWPDRFNEQDSRSDRAGPEPEGLAIGVIGDKTLAFVGLERSDAILMYDISIPSSPKLLHAVALNQGCSRPEGLLFFSIDERDYLAVASEEGGCLSIYEIR